MENILYTFIMLVSRIHTYFLTWNNSIEESFTDKELHFLIVGAFGIGLILVLHPIFLWLSKTGHTMVISFFYVFTVILVLTFAIEIGQGYTGTGVMDFDDAKMGIQGFVVFFLVFLAVRFVAHLLFRFSGGNKEDNKKDHSEFF